MTLLPLAFKKTFIASLLETTGNEKSFTEKMAWSSPAIFPTVWSEQTHKTLKSVFFAAVHSLNVCDNKLRDGNRTRVDWADSSSLIHNVVKVLPVPHAMINWPRAADWKPFTTSIIASFWCGRGSGRALRVPDSSFEISSGYSTAALSKSE